MIYEICFIRGDLPLGIARDIFLSGDDDLLADNPKLSGRLMTYSAFCDIKDSNTVKSYIERAKTILGLERCSVGSLISETVNTDMAKRNVRIGLVYYGSASFQDILGGSGWCAARPCSENKAKAKGLKLIK